MSEQTAGPPAPPRTVAVGAQEGGDRGGTREGLRERKKRQTRQLLSDTATEMFLAKGFDAVRVSEIAEACGVSEKTVFNYFPTKESLILDRLDAASSALLAALADPAVPPVDAAVRVLSDELTAMTSFLGAQKDFHTAADGIKRFGALLRSTPSLRAHQHATAERLSTDAAAVLAERAGWQAEDPEPQIAATALLGLWPVQFQSLRRHLDGAESVDQLSEKVTGDVLRAADVLRAGLDSWERRGRPHN